ncbi:hypothetical protein L6164_011895 [Bauhinia variegata]|uniref:Uncharacterized protein n=1 Tax=Bauhinia variegata TaxID=167791 RepID=A0ACB9P8E1_BAUVA|nr:hypothetical protein L6164_011895 [Bauhinia variegata]
MAGENGTSDTAGPSQQPVIDSKQDSEKGKSKDESKNTVPFYKLFTFADSVDRLLMTLGTVGATANGVAMPLMIVIMGDLIDAFGQNSDQTVVDEVSKVALRFVYLAVGTFAVAFLQVTCWMVTGERQAARIRSLYLKTILRQDISFFDKETNTGEVVGRMSGDTVLIQDAMGEKVGQFIQLMATFIAGFVIAFVNGWLLTVVMLSSIPPVVFGGALMATAIGKTASRGQAAYAAAATVVEQTIGSIRTVASFTGEKQAVTKFNQSLMKAYKNTVQEGFASGFGLGFLFLVIFCSYGLAVWYGGRLVLDKGYTGGDVMTVIFSVLTGSMSLGQASPSLTAFAAGKAAAFKMFETIERQPEIDAYDTSGKQLDDIRGDIELRGVCFSYPARPDEPIFNGFTLSIPSGTTAALVGQSGSGKSTVISLIERFYDPQSGEVLIDGVNLKEFQLKWIRQKIGLVSQEPVLFTCSIKENIAYGKEGATDEEIKAAAELANAAKFIDKLPQGLDTMVGEHGTQLSGGQKQRVAIARAILKDPRILLLDEATSALDSESERIVQEALDRIMINRTTVIVAHRLSTIRNADVIAVIHQGKIVEKGSHAELTSDPEGAYSQLIRLQEINKFMKGFSADAKKMYEKASQVANDAVGSIRTVASFCAEEKVMELYQKKCEGPIKTGIRQGIISGISFGLSFFLLFSVYATSFYAGGRFVEDGKASASDVFRVFFALTMAAIALTQSSSLAPDSGKGKASAASIFAILDRKSKIDPSDESGMTLENVKGEVEFHHVSFKYPTRPDVQIFRKLRLTIHSGKTVALVGESGSGKSTVISLLQRFYDPDSGHITLDGMEIQKLQVKWLRQQMGLVSQEPVLFNDTIRANIAYGKGGDATEAEIIAAAELANAHKFISSLQHGYDTIVGERGVQLSGGQKQRVAIARAIVKNPKILLLDEATSALDAESEKVVQDALDRVMVDRTTIVVAHRLSTIKGADMIAVVKNGVIEEKGKHETLLKKGGAYASLVALHTRASTS